MALECKNGLMELFIKVNGSITKQKVKVNSLIPMETIIRVIGNRIKLMAMAFLFTTKPVPNTRDIGKMICSMVRVLKSIVTAIDMKVCLSKEEEMVKELTTTQQDRFIREDGSMEELKVLEYAHGQMERNIRVYGKITRNMAMECTVGLMGGNTREIIEMIRSMVKVHIHGQMEGST